MSLRTLESLKQIFNLWELATWKGTVLALWVCLGSRASEQIIYLIDVSFSISITVSPEVLLTRDQADYLWRAQATTVYFRIFEHSVQFSSVAQSCPTLCDPMNRSTPGLPVHHHLPEFTQTRVRRVMMPSSHLILCRPLLLLPPILPSVNVFSNESTLRMRWPKYWSFSFSVIPSKEHPGLISFRMDWSDLLAVQGTLKSLL